MDLLARSDGAAAPPGIQVADAPDDDAGPAATDSLDRDSSLGNLLVGTLSAIALPEKPVGKLTLYFETNALADLWIAVTWRG